MNTEPEIPLLDKDFDNFGVYDEWEGEWDFDEDDILIVEDDDA